MDSDQAPRRDADVAGDDRLLAFILDRTQRRFGSLLVAAAFAIVGPVALAAWWIIGIRTGDFAGLPGFFSSWTATVGDAILLTALAAIVRSAYTDLGALRVSHGLPSQERPTFGGIAWAVGPLAVALAVVGLIQTQALMDPAIVPAWTLPRAHVLSSPGWWHGFFIAAVLYWLLALATRVVVVLRRIRTWGFTDRSWDHFEMLREKLEAAAALIAAFAALLYVDSYGYTMSLTRLSRSWTAIGVMTGATLLVIALSARFRRQMKKGGSKVPARVARRAAVADVAPWIVLACAPVVVGLTWIAGRLAAWPLIAGAAAALGVVAVVSAWFDVFRLPGRRLTPAGATVMTGAWIAVECGYLGAVLTTLTVTVPLARFSSLPAILWAAPTSSLLGAGACLALAMWLLGREEEMRPENLTEEPARGNLVRNAAWYWVMLQLVVLPVAFFAAGRIELSGSVHTLEDLLLSGIGPTAFVAMMFGYFGVVTFGLGFAIGGSWRRLRGLEKDGHESAPRVRHAIVFMSVGVATVAGMVFSAMWIGTLARFIGLATL